jgi:alkylation response protein AidB-like acyl-CoA dehydrogenase
VGELNGGWGITQGSLAHERAGLWVESVGRLEQTVTGLVELAQKLGRADDPTIRRKIAQFHELASSLRAMGYKGFASFAQGSSAPEHSYMKMATSEAGKAAYELGMEIVGPLAQVTDDTYVDSGRWSHGFFMSFANTIAGGSSEIQRNIIAQRVLGLPRA